MRAPDGREHRPEAEKDEKFQRWSQRDTRVGHTGEVLFPLHLLLCHFHGWGPVTSYSQKQASGLIGPIGHRSLTGSVASGENQRGSKSTHLHSVLQQPSHVRVALCLSGRDFSTRVPKSRLTLRGSGGLIGLLNHQQTFMQLPPTDF